nr:hypothetical protein [Tanacetum cinerariifolium]
EEEEPLVIRGGDTTVRGLALHYEVARATEYKEYLENSSNEFADSNHEKEKPPQDSDIRQLIREDCCIKVYKKQKQDMEDTMLELVEICRQKEFYCMHDNVDDLIESALNSKLLSINLESQRLDKKKQEVKNIMDQPAECGTQPDYSLSMRYKHLNTTPEMKSNEIIKSGIEELITILRECEVTLKDKRECDVLVCEDSSTFDVCEEHSEILFDSNNDDILSDDDAFEDIEHVEVSPLDLEIVSIEEENNVHQEEEEYKEYLENSSNEFADSNHEKEKPPQDSDIRQLIREDCCIKVCKKQKQDMEDTMLELVEICRQKEFYCMHYNVDDLIGSALNSKLLSINLESQRLDKKKQEVKNIMDQ